MVGLGAKQVKPLANHLCRQLALTGVSTTLRRLFAKIVVNECNGDVTPIEVTALHRQLVVKLPCHEAEDFHSCAPDAISDGSIRAAHSKTAHVRGV